VNALSLHRAAWVVPVSGPVIKDGAVAADRQHIIAVGSFTALRKKHPEAAILDHGRSALTPALINAHIHLELSHLPIASHHKEIKGFTHWIERLLSLREEMGSLTGAAEDAARDVLRRQHALGVIALGDIGNTELGAKLGSEFPGLLLHFNECLGRTAKTRRTLLARAAAAPRHQLFTAHAPYSTHAELIQRLKRRAAELNQPFPIHVAEPSSENEMLCRGTGELHSFLKGRGFIDDSYIPPAGIDNSGSVKYLHDLGVLDNRTICVHCIHVTLAEIDILAATGTKICLCPGSNRYLRVGKAPVSLFLARGLLPALGTDSLASNPELSLWREMNLLSEDHPAVEPADIFAMATLGGATTLGIDDVYGSLAPGKTARFLAIPLAENVTSEAMLHNHLVKSNSIQPIWVNEQ
jgi:cytosine/adenosine deaminase-related metal-dependent hydrolase